MNARRRELIWFHRFILYFGRFFSTLVAFFFAMSYSVWLTNENPNRCMCLCELTESQTSSEKKVHTHTHIHAVNEKLCHSCILIHPLKLLSCWFFKCQAQSSLAMSWTLAVFTGAKFHIVECELVSVMESFFLSPILLFFIFFSLYLLGY